MSWKRPDYSPREVKLLREAPYFGLDGTYWQTNETPPRSVTIKGRAGIDPDVQVVEIDGDPKPRWLMACGNTGFDGHIIGTDIWIREAV